MTRIRHLTLALALLAFAVSAIAQSGGSYLPLEVGNRWAYSSDLVGPDIKEVVSDWDAVFGEAYMIRYLLSDHSPGLQNYWSTNADGDVFLHGFLRRDPRRLIIYDPPLLVVDAPLYPGKTWVSAVDLLLEPGGQSAGRYVVRYTVTDPQTFTIEGVEVQAHGVLETSESEDVAGVGAQWLTDGRPFDPGKDQVIVPHWWTPGVGEIQYRSLGIFHLVGYSFDHVANEQKTWSDLKTLYR